jgi:hypothetical protein
MGEMDMDFVDQLTLLNITTGKIVTLLREFITYAEEGKPFDNQPQWQQEQMILAIDVLENEDKYIPLPSKFEVDEYGMMEDFSFKQTGEKRTRLLHAIDGKGAFRRFKDKVYQMDLDDLWYTFREGKYKQIAINYCEQHGLKYE